MTTRIAQSTLVSIAIHLGAIALLLLVSKQVSPRLSRVSSITIAPLIAPFLPHPTPDQMPGAGGGMRRQIPATAGHLPKIARQFIPPALEIANPKPELVMQPTIDAPPDASLSDSALTAIGDSLGNLMNNSAGMGGPLGIGNGRGTAIGDGLTGTVYRQGNGVTAPVLIHSVEPGLRAQAAEPAPKRRKLFRCGRAERVRCARSFGRSDEARKARYSGIVKLGADIDGSGHPRNIRVVQSLGMGLDERAVEALALWLFRPGTKDGKPVAVSALVEVSFRLL